MLNEIYNNYIITNHCIFKYLIQFMIPFSPSPIQIFFFYWILLELILCRCYYRSNSSSPTWGVMLVSYMLVNFWQKIRSSLDLEI